MSKEYPIFKEYMLTNDKVSIRDENGQLHHEKIFPNIDDVLVMLNREALVESVLDEEIRSLNDYNKQLEQKFYKYNSVSSIIGGTFSGLSISGLLNNLQSINPTMFAIPIGIFGTTAIAKCGLVKRSVNLQMENLESIRAISALCQHELVSIYINLMDLLSDKIEIDGISKCNLISVPEDLEYCDDFADRISKFGDFGRNKSRMLSMQKKKNLDSYFDSIGCSEDDKKIFLNLLECEDIGQMIKSSSPQKKKVQKGSIQ